MTDAVEFRALCESVGWGETLNSGLSALRTAIENDPLFVGVGLSDEELIKACENLRHSAMGIEERDVAKQMASLRERPEIAEKLATLGNKRLEQANLIQSIRDMPPAQRMAEWRKRANEVPDPQPTRTWAEHQSHLSQLHTPQARINYARKWGLT